MRAIANLYRFSDTEEYETIMITQQISLDLEAALIVHGDLIDQFHIVCIRHIIS